MMTVYRPTKFIINLNTNVHCVIACTARTTMLNKQKSYHFFALSSCFYWIPNIQTQNNYHKCQNDTIKWLYNMVSKLIGRRHGKQHGAYLMRKCTNMTISTTHTYTRAYVILHEDVIKWKHFLRYWPFVWGNHRSPLNSPQKGKWHGALMFSLIFARINGWVNNREAGDLRRHRGHYDVTVMDFGAPTCYIWCVYLLIPGGGQTHDFTIACRVF